MIHRLAEVGYLYARVDYFVNERDNAVGVGLIEQSLCHHLQAQLTEFYRLIAILESQMVSDGKAEVIGNEQQLDERTGLTLRRLDVWINDWRLRMRMMSVCVEGARGKLATVGTQMFSNLIRRCPWRRTGQPDSRLYGQW